MKQVMLVCFGITINFRMLPCDTIGNFSEKDNIDVLQFASILYAAESNY